MNTATMRLTNLDQYGIVSISGADATAFLQRQFTNDMSEITPEKAGFSAYLNPKGRILANFIIALKNDRYILALSADLVESFVKRLRMFVMRDKVDIAVESGMQLIGAVGTDLPFAANNLPELDFESVSEAGMTIVKMPGTQTRFAVFGDRLDFEGLADQFDTSLADEWDSFDIDCMFSLITQTTVEQLVPQAANLDLVGAVSFTKGCYPGQEIVARLHYKGGVNRRMFRSIVPADSVAQAGALVYCDTLQGNQTGMITDCSLAERGQSKRLLISVPLKFINQQGLRLEDGTDIELELDNLPYSIPEL